MKKILVVGGAGFIGSEVNKLLSISGYETFVVDNLSHGNKRCVKWGHFIKGDIGNKKFLEKLFNEHAFDAVMHFAAFIDVGESVLNPGKYYQNNVAATLCLIDVMQTHGVKSFIFSSSAAVYGTPEHERINEEHSTLPINPYGYSKLIIEQILADYDSAYGLKSISLRYFNAAGGDPEGEIKNYNQRKSNLIPIVIRCFQNDQPVTIYGSDYDTPDGTCVRDYVHIYDLATAHVKAMENLLKHRQSKVYNLGNGNGYSVKEVIKAVEKVIKKPIKVVEGPRRQGDPDYLLADATKAKQELGWTIKYPDLEAMIRHAWNARTKMDK